MTGDVDAVTAALRVMAHRDRLLGLGKAAAVQQTRCSIFCPPPNATRMATDEADEPDS